MYQKVPNLCLCNVPLTAAISKKLWVQFPSQSHDEKQQTNHS